MPSGSTFPTGNTAVTYTAVDQSGNITLCTFNVNVTSTTAVNEVVKPDRFIAYPNPVHSELHISMISGAKAKEYRILSMTGTEVQSGTLNSFAATINTEILIAGTYFLEIISADKTISHQTIIKQ
jgi:hypothetical protein